MKENLVYLVKVTSPSTYWQPNIIICGRSLTCKFVSDFCTEYAGQLAVSGQFEVVVQWYGLCLPHGAVYTVNHQMAVLVNDISAATRVINELHARPSNICTCRVIYFLLCSIHNNFVCLSVVASNSRSHDLCKNDVTCRQTFSSPPPFYTVNRITHQNVFVISSTKPGPFW